MKILETLQNEDVKAPEKLQAVVDLVSTIRKKYGNGDKEVEPSKVSTTDGNVPVTLLTTEEKVAVAQSAIKNAALQATAICEGAEAAVFDREFERIIAVDSVLSNLNKSSDSQY